MAPVVLVTFAGRQARMEILNRDIRRALELGRRSRLGDDVIRARSPYGLEGRHLSGQGRGFVGKGLPRLCQIELTGDPHLAVIPNDRADAAYEIVIGGWGNMHSEIRRIRKADLAHSDRDNPQYLVVSANVVNNGVCAHF